MLTLNMQGVALQIGIRPTEGEITVTVHLTSKTVGGFTNEVQHVDFLSSTAAGLSCLPCIVS
jgi:hypothetical protein